MESRRASQANRPGCASSQSGQRGIGPCSYRRRFEWVIAAQRPTATHLEGMRSWNELGRSVRPGEKGIRIFAPSVGIKSASQIENQAQEVSKKPARGKKAAEPAKPTEQQPETQLLGFRAVSVFDRLSRDLRPGLCAPM